LPLIVKFIAIAFPPAVRAERIRSGSSGVSNIRAAVAARMTQGSAQGSATDAPVVFLDLE
jgi:hypothetical protein